MTQIKVELQETMGSDRSIAEAAWTSSLDYQKKQSRTDEDVARVVKMLAELKHSVPFESVVLRFWLKLPIAIDRQLMTHRVGSHCLTGDNFLYFDLPAGQKRGNRKIFKITVEDFYKKWNFGVKFLNRWGKTDYKNHKNRLKKMKLRSCDENTGEIIYTNVDDIFRQGINPVFKFTFENGYSITSTLNHRYLTDQGWKTIGDALEINESLEDNPKYFRSDISFSVNGQLAYKDYEYVKNLREKGFSVQEMADDMGISYHTVRKWLKIHKLSFTKEEVCFKKGSVPWNINKKYKMKNPYKLTEDDRKKRRELFSGSRSNFWRGGKASETQKIRSECSNKLKSIVFKRDNYTCQNRECGSKKDKLNAHHIIPLYVDTKVGLELDNLITLCIKCHKHIHAKHLEADFAKTLGIKYEKKEKKHNSSKLIRKFSKVVNVEYIGKKETFDLTVSGPFHNFVCNGIVVHNSGLSARYRTMPSEYFDLTDDVQEIIYKLPVVSSVETKKGTIYGDEDYMSSYYRACETSNNVYNFVVEVARKAQEDGAITNPEFKRLREFYRGVLPQHNMTERVTIMNLRSFANFQKLRNSEHAQPEIRYLAQLMLEEVEKSNVAPVAIEWLKKNNWSL